MIGVLLGVLVLNLLGRGMREHLGEGRAGDEAWWGSIFRMGVC